MRTHRSHWERNPHFKLDLIERVWKNKLDLTGRVECTYDFQSIQTDYYVQSHASRQMFVWNGPIGVVRSFIKYVIIRRKWNSSQNSGMDEQNRPQKRRKAFHPLHWEGDGISFLGSEKKSSSLNILSKGKPSLGSTTYRSWTDWRRNRWETSGNSQENSIVLRWQCTAPLMTSRLAKIDRTALLTTSASSLYTRSSSFGLPSFLKKQKFSGWTKIYVKEIMLKYEVQHKT